ncbi:hypothetical protein E2C01_021650 [Portunus trituberculatus]|uniref:Uncharacterized protein n=1 Tax=Portunus trituberculatus TaxID=210409 RepID=A0A5B7E549_PORTR|nr:hypothetical protein [Portunus trituberculatus]
MSWGPAETPVVGSPREGPMGAPTVPTFPPGVFEPGVLRQSFFSQLVKIYIGIPELGYGLIPSQSLEEKMQYYWNRRAANPSMSLQHIPLIGVQHLTSTVIVQQPLLMPTWLRNLNLVIDHSKVNKATVKVSSRGGNVKSLYF